MGAHHDKLGELETEQPAKQLVSKLEELQSRRAELAVAQFRTGWTRRVKASLVHYRLTRYFDLLDRAARGEPVPGVHRGEASGAGNLLYPMHRALQQGATLGEVSDALVGVFGRYRPGS